MIDTIISILFITIILIAIVSLSFSVAGERRNKENFRYTSAILTLFGVITFVVFITVVFLDYIVR